MRKFYISSGNSRIYLNAETGIFLHEPSGLGYELEETYINTTSGFFASALRKESQGEISGTLIFLPECMTSIEPYANYKRFIFDIEKLKTFEFIYSPNGLDEYVTDCRVKKIEKSEYDKYGALNCSFIFTRLTPWYIEHSPKRMVRVKHNINAFKYGSKFDNSRYDTSINTGYYYDFENNGTRPATLRITYKGKFTNIIVSVQGKNTGNVYGFCNLPIHLNSDETFVYCTTYTGSYIHRVLDDNTVDNLIDSVDISAKPFLRIPNDEPCRVFVNADGLMSAPTIEFVEYFRSV